jgi:hypothetical protein
MAGAPALKASAAHEEWVQESYNQGNTPIITDVRDMRRIEKEAPIQGARAIRRGRLGIFSGPLAGKG